MHGSYHSVSGQHFPGYLAEFCYRFNRRFSLEDMIPGLGYAALRTPPMPQRLLKVAEACVIRNFFVLHQNSLMNL